MYMQARDAVHKLDVHLGRKSDLQSDQLAEVAEARHNGLTKIDGIRLSSDGSQVMIAQGNPDSPDKQAAYMQTAHAVNTPIDQNSAAARAIPQKAAEPAQSPNPATPQLGNPAMVT